jgi:hypothetical protein
VIELKGPSAVFVMADGCTPPDRAGELLPPDATVKTHTDSTMKLLFANGAIVILQPRSQLRVALFASKDSLEALKNLIARTLESFESTTNLDLKSGTVLIDVPTLKKESKFEVTTPHGIAGVSGTRSYVNTRKNCTAVGVSEGLAVATPLLDESVQVRPNQALGLTAKGLTPANANEFQYIQTLSAATATPQKNLQQVRPVGGSLPHAGNHGSPHPSSQGNRKTPC